VEQNYVSHELTHFVGGGLPTDDERFRLFLEILRQRWLQASYREQLGAGLIVRSDGGKELSSNEAVISTTLCFCDIPESELCIHVQKYGPFGIAFTKTSLLKKGASPVFYVAKNASALNLAPGIGARTLGETLNELQRDLAAVCAAFDEYVWSREPEGPVPGLRITFKHSPKDTPEGHRALGKLHALQSDLNKVVFSYLKFFTAELKYEDPENYYMEREWRIRDGLAFGVGDVSALYMPSRYRDPLLKVHPEYKEKIRLIDQL